MTVCSSGSLIDAPAEHVWSILADVESWPDWADSFSAINRLDSSPIGPGSVVSIKQPNLPAGTWTITEWIPGKSFKWVSRRFAMTATANHILVSESTHCRFEQTMLFEGLVGKLSALLGRRLIAKYMASEAEGLKRVSEARWSNAAS